MAAPEGEDDSPEEKQRIAFQTELQDVVHKYVTAGVKAHIALQETSRLVGDVMYRICLANKWLDDEGKRAALFASVANEAGFAYMSCVEHDDQTPDEPPPRVH